MNSINFLMAALSTFLVICACTNEERSSARDHEIHDDLSGESLSKLYCTKCHLYTSPGLLDKSSWPPVLRQMRYFMGMRYPGENPFEGKGLQEGLYLETADVFPNESVISTDHWKKIEAFFLEEAPDSLTLRSKLALPPNELFTASLKSPDLGGFPAVTMLDFDEVNGRLYVADINGQMVELNKDFEKINFTQLRNPIVKSIRRHDANELLLLDIGLMDPKDIPFGAVIMTDIRSFSKRSLIFEELARPVDLALADLDQDGREDIVVCNFGHLVGDFSWFRNMEKGYQKILLSDEPGSIKVEALDIGADGDQDLIVLSAHGDECILMYVNDGSGRFTIDTLLRMHPLFGSTDFHMVDFNNDGDLDIVLANGDNSDQSQILKPYHGIRLYENDGNFNFREAFFYPMHGAYKVIMHDFDEDGDRDIFANAFHPDYEEGLANSLVFLENEGGMEFRASGFDLAADGRWMVMDMGDLDDDGDQDIIVGSFALGPGNVPPDVVKRWRTSSNHLLFLENKTR